MRHRLPRHRSQEIGQTESGQNPEGRIPEQRCRLQFYISFALSTSTFDFVIDSADTDAYLARNSVIPTGLILGVPVAKYFAWVKVIERHVHRVIMQCVNEFRTLERVKLIQIQILVIDSPNEYLDLYELDPLQ